MSNLLAIDTETHLIGKGQVTPPVVCAQFAVLDEGQPLSWIAEKANPTFKEQVIEAFADESLSLIFQNAAYDLTVLAKAIPETMPLIWKALDDGRVHDTMIREMLYNLTATGDIDNIELNGVVQRAEYSLAGMTKKYLGIDRSEDKEGEGSVRLSYHMVEHDLLADWPEEFIKYALNDPSDTLLVFLEQSKVGRDLQVCIGYDPFITESFRVRSHFALQLMTEHGNLLDEDKVYEVATEFDVLYNDPDLVKPLVLSHFIEEYAKSNGVTMSEGVVVEAMGEFDGTAARFQKKWLGTGMVIPAVEPAPYKTGQREHHINCIGHKENPRLCRQDHQGLRMPPKNEGGPERERVR